MQARQRPYPYPGGACHSVQEIDIKQSHKPAVIMALRRRCPGLGLLWRVDIVREVFSEEVTLKLEPKAEQLLTMAVKAERTM